MRRVLVDVDTQVDFCEPAGASFIRGAPTILPVCRALVRHACARGELIVGSVDTHAFQCREFNTVKTGGRPGPFAPHAIKGTPGWLKVDGTLPARAVFVPAVEHDFEPPPGCEGVYFEKDGLSLLANPVVGRFLVRLAGQGGERPTFTVMGVALDWCVSRACRALVDLALGDVEIVVDAVAAVVPAAAERVLEGLRASGVRTVTSAQVRATP